MPRSGMAGSYSSSLYSFLRNICTIVYNVCTNLHSHQQCMMVPFSIHPVQHLLCVDIFMIAILTNERQYFIVALICISLIMSNVEHHFMCLLAIFVSSLEKCLFRSSACVLIGLFCFCWGVWAICGEGNGTPLQYSCLENPRDGGAWWVTESRTRLSDFTFTFHSYALEKEMATHSSVLALRIPGTGEPGGLPSLGSHRVGHDWSDLAAWAICMFWESSPCQLHHLQIFSLSL